MLKTDTLIVLPYVQSCSQGEEIRLALSAWNKFCTFDYHFIVIGEFSQKLIDEYKWVEFIKCPRREKINNQYNPHLDMMNKFNIVMQKYSDQYDGFIYMVDDNYAIKSFDLRDITTTYYLSKSFEGNPRCPTSYWNHNKWKTRQLLDRENLQHINYTTHFPYYMEFSKLKEIIDKYDLINESYVFDDIYFNYFEHPSPVHVDKIRLGIWNKDIYENQFQNAINNPNIKFVCNSVSGWSKELEESLWKIIKDDY